MPSKKRKYNARFPAGRIKKIMQTDEEVGKVAQAVPIIISPRTLELFVQSLLSAALQVTMSRNAKTLSPSHLKQCIRAEARFDFLHDLVKNIPDVSAAEEKEIMSAENSPNTSRFTEMSVPRRVGREDSNSSSSSDVRVASLREPRRAPETDKPTATAVSTDSALDLTYSRTANFYQETLNLEEVPHASVITPNPIYTSAQASTSFVLQRTPSNSQEVFSIKPLNNNSVPKTPVTPILNIDFTNPSNPEIKVLDSTAATLVADSKMLKALSRQNSRQRIEIKKPEPKPSVSSVNIDSINSGNLEIDEDYDA